MGTDGTVAVITGSGGMGTAIARRIGAGSTVLLADHDEAILTTEASALAAAGFTVVPHRVDVADAASVQALASRAAELGRVTVLVHTAGVSPVQAGVAAIVAVDLVGTAIVLDAFGEVVERGGAGVCISSMAGAMASLDPEVERLLAMTPTAELANLAQLGPDRLTDPGTAYTVAKRANQLRVRAAAVAWGRRGARVNSISPGVISTAMGAAELGGPSGEIMRQMIDGSPTGRIGTAEDIAAAAAFLLGRDAAFVTGTDLLVDGGVIAAITSSA